jgi:hypothetical protein
MQDGKYQIFELIGKNIGTDGDDKQGIVDMA